MIAALLKVIGGLWALLGGFNIVMMEGWPDRDLSGWLAFGLIFNFLLFVAPGLVLYGIGAVITRKSTAVQTPSSNESGPLPFDERQTVDDRLTELASLRAQGFIGEEEYANLRAEAARDDPGDQTKRCPYCGEQILAIAIRCKHCRSDLGPTSAALPKRPAEQPKRSNENSVETRETATSQLLCPKCSSRDVQRVAAAYKSGAGGASAWRLAPPELSTSQEARLVGAVIGMLIVIGFMAVISGVHKARLLSHPGMWFWVVIGGALLGQVFAPALMKAMRSSKGLEEHRHKLMKWNREVVCLSCGHIFENTIETAAK